MAQRQRAQLPGATAAAWPACSELGCLLGFSKSSPPPHNCNHGRLVQWGSTSYHHQALPISTLQETVLSSDGTSSIPHFSAASGTEGLLGSQAWPEMGVGVPGKSSVFGGTGPGLGSRLCHLKAVQPWADGFPSLKLGVSRATQASNNAHLTGLSQG